MWLTKVVTFSFKVGVTVTAPSRRPVISRVLDVAERPGVYRIEFTPEEVGTHLIDVSIWSVLDVCTLVGLGTFSA